jgi:hypothetical protein
MVQKEMNTPMPQTSSKLADFDYSDFLKKDPDHLSCPECEIIPAIFIEIGKIFDEADKVETPSKPIQGSGWIAPKR